MQAKTTNDGLETTLQGIEKLIVESVRAPRKSSLADGQRWRDYAAEQDRQRALGKSLSEASRIADRFAAEQSAKRAAIVEALKAGQYATDGGIALGGEFRGRAA